MHSRTIGSRFVGLLAVFLAALGLIAGFPSMLPAASNTTTAEPGLDSALKVIFSEPLINNVVSDTELLSIFQTDMSVQEDPTTGGRYIESAHLFQLPAGVGARLENEYIPEADAPIFLNSRVLLKKIQGVVEMTGDTMRRVTSNEGAYLDYLDQALPKLSERLVHELDRMYIGFNAGVKARIAAGGIGAYNAPLAGQFIITMDRSFGITGYTNAFLNFLEGERVGFTGSLVAPVALRNAGATQAASVVSIDEVNSTITVAGTAALQAALVAGDYIASADSAGNSFPTGNPGVERELTGLLGAVDDGSVLPTYFNITRAGNRLWNSIVIDGSLAPWNGALTEDLLTYADDTVMVRGAGKIDTLVMSREALRGYWKSLKSDRIFMDPRGSYQGGKGKGVEIVLGDRTLALKVARKLPPQVAFGLQSNVFKRFTLGQWEWDDKTGAIWNRVTDGTGRKDAYFAVGNMYEQLFNTAPRKSFKIQGLLAVQ